MKHLTMDELEQGLELIKKAPKNEGTLELIVIRPKVNEREVLKEGTLDLAEGLVGDSWKQRGSGRMEDKSAHPEMQLNIMNARVINLIAQEKERWALAGDQLYLDLDLSLENLPHGTQLSLGSAIIEVTPQPHTGCKKFVERFGLDAMKFVNSPLGRALNLRGINAKIIKNGNITVGDIVKKL